MLRVAIAIVMAAVSAASYAEAPTGYSVREIAACKASPDPYLTADSLSAKRSKSSVVVVVKASLNCSSEVQSKVGFVGKAISIRLDQQFPKSSPVAGCNCIRAFEVAITQRVELKSVVYLVKDGNVTTHAAVL